MSELAQQAATLLFRADAPLPAAIVFAEVARGRPEDPAVWCGLGSAVARCVGVFVVAPFVQWGTRCFRRSLALAPAGEWADVSREWPADLAQRPGYQDLPPIEPRELDELLAFLEVEPGLVIQGIDRVPAEDQMFLIMAIGDLGRPRFVPVVAAAVSGRWGGGAARAGLKRIGTALGSPEVRAAMASLRASPLGAECDPYLSWAEGKAAEVPVEIGVEPAVVAKPWWKVW